MKGSTTLRLERALTRSLRAPRRSGRRSSGSSRLGAAVLRRRRVGRVYLLESELWLPRSAPEIFPFFSEAGNLEILSADWLHFEVTMEEGVRLQEGTKVDYRLRFHGLRLRCRNEITVWEPPYRFISEQRRGPFRSWRHEHIFVEQNRGTLLRDQIEYSVRGGALVHAVFVKRAVEEAFEYRQRTLLDIFSEDA